MRLTNNIIYAVGGEDYIAPGSNTALITGTNNLWFGGGAAPGFLMGNISADPRFVSIVALDFHLQADSPAIDAGVATVGAMDFDGVPRPQGSGFDLGALEFVSAPADAPTTLRN